MKAVIINSYGDADVFQIQDISKTKISIDEVLIEVKSGSVTSGEARIRAINVPEGMSFFVRLMFGFKKPKYSILGSEFSGIITETGADVTEFNVGDKVFGYSSKSGANAEFMKIKADNVIVKMSNNMSFEDAASIPFGFGAAHYFLTKAGVKSGDKVLINGASGSVGTAAVQLAKIFGAEVTGISTKKNHELISTLGADFVIDYKSEDFTKLEKKYDVILDTIGKLNFSDSKDSLVEKGKFVQMVGGLPFYLRMFISNIFNSKKIVSGVSNDTKEKLDYLKDLYERKMIKPVISKIYSLDEIVRAHEYVDSGHKIGNVVLKISE
ncbi:MAG: NAD(P)-dependent alcohol dehydrogenase [Candidatus Dojkabacteria bacterium]|nr:NAD(P)-dependent alcohol dehydrogenase [Candidatus Dojkabacteria bacterium]